MFFQVLQRKPLSKRGVLRTPSCLSAQSTRRGTVVESIVMSYRELRNFTEIMRALGYPRRISVDNFRTPNFQLVADALYWMVKRYDPSIHITEDIDTEDDRVEFLSSAAQAMAAKAKIKLNTKRLYAADGKAVKELLKVANILYNALRANKTQLDEEDADTTPMPSQLKNVKGARALATEITEGGARLFDLLGKEKDVRNDRSRALRFLDTISGSLNNTTEHAYVERSAKELVSALKENIDNMKVQCEKLEADEKGLDTKIKRKQAELERHEKRLHSLQTVRPAFMDEYEKLEQDLQRHYDVYIERFRNLDYLEHELDVYNQGEREKMEENERSLKKLQKQLREEEIDYFRGKGQYDEEKEGNPRSPLAKSTREEHKDSRTSSANPDGRGDAAINGSMEDSGMSSPSDVGSESSGSIESDEGLSSGSDGSEVIDSASESEISGSESDGDDFPQRW